MTRLEVAKHEQTDANARGVTWVGIGLVVGIVASQFLLRSIFWRYHDSIVAHEPKSNPALVAERKGPPEPRLQVDPLADINAYRAQEDRLLTSYGWVDKTKQTVHIPIARAMEILSHER
jgi:hypothetical protein